jgi:hypothetical protein
LLPSKTVAAGGNEWSNAVTELATELQLNSKNKKNANANANAADPQSQFPPASATYDDRPLLECRCANPLPTQAKTHTTPKPGRATTAM